MIKLSNLLLLLAMSAGLSPVSMAHDPKEHQAKKPHAPPCAKLKLGAADGVDQNDTIIKALKMKCARHMQGEGAPVQPKAST